LIDFPQDILALQLPFSEMSALGCGLVCPAPE
jgi:hypothetical protein